MLSHILLDMDGVVADFFTAAIKRFQPEVRKLYRIHIDEDIESSFPRNEYDLPKLFKVSRETFDARLADQAFWEDEIRMYPGARDFVATLKKHAPVSFCTVPMSPESVAGKIRWADKHFRDLPDPLTARDRRPSLCEAPHVIVCPDRQHKALLARYNVLLIDDHPDTVKEFRAAGGQAVYVPRPWSQPRGSPCDLLHAARGSMSLRFDTVRFDKVLADVEKMLQ